VPAFRAPHARDGAPRPPEARGVRAGGLAALAEAGVLVLPVWLVLTESRGVEIGVIALAVPFVAVYVGGALLACRFRASRNVAFGAAMLAVLSGIWLGHDDLNRIVFSVLVCLLVSFRLVTLALRDWRVREAWFVGARVDCHFMHCLPVRRNVAVADEVLDGPRSQVIREAANRMVVQMAVLYRLLKG